MKKVFIILAALIVSFLLAEIITGSVIGYPKRTGQRKFIYATHLIDYEVLKWKAPYTRYWTVEGGNTVHSYNNLGLPGIDVNISDSTKFIYVLGDSFIEGLQMPPEEMATSVFQNYLTRNNIKNFDVLNLGFSNSDAYVLWFRSNFFEQHFKPDYVYLMITSLEILDLNLQRHNYPLNFSLPENFGKVIPETKKEKFLNIFRNSSSVINIIINGLNTANTNPEVKYYFKPDTSGAVKYSKTLRNLKDCLEQFKSRYKDKFYVVTIEPEERNVEYLREICDMLNINFKSEKLLIPEYQLETGGHLNKEGNQKLGELLYDGFIEIYKK